ncbi:formate dehydrogenase accessory sulfurtransferase FdhD [Marinobacter sp. SS21]|uniref:formate dehydrogenase accessory sulfurtransferase FdhD n=1 Tax=Marinobacter sp. SS21 TaxID=2979460 RepID=UPI00232B23E1|nr:formate dehydrogenase accessory sulfurtransferase FdhD [Marinobacter sp. SS21]MDC0664275.1 formate dehydrogenase accessory sulfurtransferase FdhD [Marinobacter sp. SS21]
MITSAPVSFEYREINSRPTLGSSNLAHEAALAISYNGINQAVMMMSPEHLEDFVRGFSLSNGFVGSVDELYDIRISGSGESFQADVEISNRALWALKRSRRQLAGTSGCGICGVEAIEQALPQLTALSPAPIPNAASFKDLRHKISTVQHAARPSGALHAALYVAANGDISLCREDIGRHNALDKLIGAMSRSATDPRAGFAVVTSRCSLELIQKAVRARFGTLVSLSAPTALTVQWARRLNLNLIHIPHHSAPRLYSPAPIL